ncbi:MAG: Stk1 family PASTA domain-containing Ser/Thr kinase [Clostridiales bacterium]|jgi:serine/threonine-protein kinase|nr:Stk1 family PASTA domain-containing Ser/Thr kinase [Clostridiales bacterium]
MIQVGNLFANRYEILAEIGTGGMANVYKAKDNTLNRFVAIKVLKDEFKDDDEFVMRFRSEAQSAAVLTHQNLVSIYDVGVYDDTYYIVMEFVDGITLKEYIRQNNMLSWQQAVQFTQQILRGIEHAHKKGIVHRDIKPHNIMVTKNGLLKVMDFGIARTASSYTVKMGDTTIGSVHYFSPEQARGRHTDERSDIYSLGIVMYEMLTGHVPFDGTSTIAVAMMHINNIPISPKEYNISIPLSIEDILAKAIAKDIIQRYQSATDMLLDLQLALSNPDVSPVREAAANAGTTILDDDLAQTRLMQAVPDSAIIHHGEGGDVLPQPEPYVPKNRAIRKAQERKRIEANSTPEQLEERKNKKATIWAIISVGVLLLAIGFLLVLALFPNLLSPKDYIDVPDLVGQNIADVQTKYANSKITITVGSKEPSDTLDKDLIISQTPTSGTKMNSPLEITVVVSDGLKEGVLPNVVGDDKETAIKKLEALGLKVKEVKESHATINADNVISTSPAAGGSYKAGDTIELHVSVGRNGSQITMPSLIGFNRDKAKEILDNAKLTLGKVTIVDSTSEADFVIDQSVKSGSTITEFSTVDITVSSGKAPSPSPAVTTKTISISVPTDKDVTRVKVVADGKVVSDANHNKGEGKFSVSISGSGSVKVEVYYDGVLTKTQTVTM